MNLSNLLKKREARIIIVDLLMIFILIINLNLIVFDWIFSYLMVQNLLEKYLPSFFYFYYENVHKDFLRVDLYFVTVFVVELLIRWGIAIKEKRYQRWFFYPFVHWYDVLGCIPVGEFRFLRILRVISIMLRLQKLEIIDLTKTYLFDRIAKYMNILVEEVSDRVVVNVLENIQDEIHEGTPVSDRVITEVIMPQKTLLVEWLSQRLQTVSSDAHRTYKEDIQQYVEKRIADAVNNNKEIKDIGIIPVFGSMISRNLERAISDIVFSVVNGIIQDLASTHNREIVSDLTDLTLETILVQGNDEKANLMVKEMVLQSIEIVKDQVKVKKWKVKDEREKEERIKNRLKEAIE
jgi:hypothetical protein